MRSRLVLCATVLLLAGGCGGSSPKPEATFPAGDIVDLSHAYDEQTIFWPTAAEGFRLRHDAEGMTPAGYYYAAKRQRVERPHYPAPVLAGAPADARAQVPAR